MKARTEYEKYFDKSVKYAIGVIGIILIVAYLAIKNYYGI